MSINNIIGLHGVDTKTLSEIYPYDLYCNDLIVYGSNNIGITGPTGADGPIGPIGPTGQTGPSDSYVSLSSVASGPNIPLEITAQDTLYKIPYFIPGSTGSYPTKYQYINNPGNIMVFTDDTFQVPDGFYNISASLNVASDIFGPTGANTSFDISLCEIVAGLPNTITPLLNSTTIGLATVGPKGAILNIQLNINVQLYSDETYAICVSRSNTNVGSYIYEVTDGLFSLMKIG